eukprot:TRINITY_DN18048_c0_g2_i1.p1 TRINITY_DN18048_c0_g2~~TRINITY_DN18048_c0_g2_i1.p1  ORF type:complete len:106 (+),score=0.19 TRINITY_DN18048_c0_g2_i1:48-365(+)
MGHPTPEFGVLVQWRVLKHACIELFCKVCVPKYCYLKYIHFNCIADCEGKGGIEHCEGRLHHVDDWDRSRALSPEHCLHRAPRGAPTQTGPDAVVGTKACLKRAV